MRLFIALASSIIFFSKLNAQIQLSQFQTFQWDSVFFEQSSTYSLPGGEFPRLEAHEDGFVISSKRCVFFYFWWCLRFSSNHKKTKTQDMNKFQKAIASYIFSCVPVCIHLCVCVCVCASIRNTREWHRGKYLSSSSSIPRANSSEHSFFFQKKQSKKKPWKSMP